MATMNPQKREEVRYSGGITGASTVNSTYADGSNAPILSGQSLATAQFGSGSPAVTFDYSSPKTSVAKKTTTISATPKTAPKSTVSSSVATAKAATATKVASRVRGDSYSSPTKAAPTSRADSGSLSKVSLKMPGIGPMASKPSAPAAPKPKASVSNMYKATYGTPLPKIGAPATPEQKAAKKASISKMYTATYGRPLQPKAKAKKPVSSSVKKMYEETYGKKLK